MGITTGKRWRLNVCARTRWGVNTGGILSASKTCFSFFDVAFQDFRTLCFWGIEGGLSFVLSVRGAVGDLRFVQRWDCYSEGWVSLHEGLHKGRGETTRGNTQEQDRWRVRVKGQGKFASVFDTCKFEDIVSHFLLS
jgi:hypothetical protein